MQDTPATQFDRWFANVTKGNHDTAILCFPYAGSGTATFGAWRAEMFAGADLYAAQLPGRDARLRECPMEGIDPLVDELAAAILSSPMRQARLVLLGCSVGGLVAFELARRLRRSEIAIDYLIVAACRAPQSARWKTRLHTLPDEQLVRKVQKRYAAIPPEILQHQEMMRLLLPTLRADLKMFETYTYRREPPLACPILAIGGSQDRSVPVRDLFEWRKQTTGSFRQRSFPGGHFFVKPAKRSVLKTIARRLQIGGVPGPARG